MLKRVFIVLGLGCIITLLLVACGGTTSSSTTTTKNAVHMDDSNFTQPSITIKKGESLALIDDSTTPHVIANGTWENNTAKVAQEPGAPAVKDVQINGGSQDTVGPFTTAGTFKLYCTIHPGMNLTVIVQ